MAADPHCIPCERYDNWVEVDIRDEHNRSFKGLKATLTDETGKSETITLQTHSGARVCSWSGDSKNRDASLAQGGTVP